MPNFIIIANGDFLIREIIIEAIAGKTIVALDGAANKLVQLGIKPDVILGDFDSITELSDNSGITIVPARDQNETDLVKGIHYCDTEGASQIDIICAMGGRMDHHEYALRALHKVYRKDRPMFLHTEQQTLCCAIDETITVRGEVGDKCGIMALPKGSFTAEGLVWNNCPLFFATRESVSNELLQTTATITATGSLLIIMPPFLPSQRNFMNKSEVERLTLRLRDATWSSNNG